MANEKKNLLRTIKHGYNIFLLKYLFLKMSMFLDEGEGRMTISHRLVWQRHCSEPPKHDSEWLWFQLTNYCAFWLLNNKVSGYNNAVLQIFETCQADPLISRITAIPDISHHFSEMWSLFSQSRRQCFEKNNTYLLQNVCVGNYIDFLWWWKQG